MTEQASLKHFQQSSDPSIAMAQLAYRLSRGPTENIVVALNQETTMNECPYDAVKPAVLAASAIASREIVELICAEPLGGKPLFAPNTFAQLQRDLSKRAQTGLTQFKRQAASETVALLDAASKRRIETTGNNVGWEAIMADAVLVPMRWGPRLMQTLGKAALVLPRSKREDALRASHRPLRDLASISTDHLRPLDTAYSQNLFPDAIYDYELRRIELTVDPLDIPLSERMHRFANDRGIETEDIKTIRELPVSSTTVRCPMLLNPELVQVLWNHQIDTAIDRNLLFKS